MKYEKRTKRIIFKMTCPFRTGTHYCTHIANTNLTRKRKKYLYPNFSECPYMKNLVEQD